jgi:hypothetical protein
MHDLFDVVKRLCEIPGNFQAMTFHAHLSWSMRELSHGRVYKESPFFTHRHVTANAGTADATELSHGDSVQYTDPNDGQLRTGRIVGIYTEQDDANGDLGVTIMRYFEREENSRKWWLIWDEPQQIPVKSITRKVEFEILARSEFYNGDKTKDVCVGASVAGDSQHYDLFEMPTLLFELIPLETLAAIDEHIHQNADALLRFFLVYFYDDFAAYKKKVHSIGGGYITLGNLPRRLQILMKNILPVHLGPDGVDQCEVAAAFDEQVIMLEKGIVKIRINGIEYICMGGIGLVKADMPQGQKVAAIYFPDCPFRFNLLFIHTLDLRVQGVRDSVRTMPMLQRVGKGLVRAA